MNNAGHWQNLTHECHTHSEQMQLALGKLMDLIPEPDNNGIDAHTFLKMLLRLETLHAESLHEEIRYLEKDNGEVQPIKKAA